MILNTKWRVEWLQLLIGLVWYLLIPQNEYLWEIVQNFGEKCMSDKNINTIG